MKLRQRYEEHRRFTSARNLSIGTDHCLLHKCAIIVINECTISTADNSDSLLLTFFALRGGREVPSRGHGWYLKRHLLPTEDDGRLTERAETEEFIKEMRSGLKNRREQIEQPFLEIH